MIWNKNFEEGVEILRKIDKANNTLFIAKVKIGTDWFFVSSKTIWRVGTKGKALTDHGKDAHKFIDFDVALDVAISIMEMSGGNGVDVEEV